MLDGPGWTLWVHWAHFFQLQGSLTLGGARAPPSAKWSGGQDCQGKASLNTDPDQVPSSWGLCENTVHLSKIKTMKHQPDPQIRL